MKSTGVIRRIDDLGRIVIPKEIRKNLSIRDGENLEILVNEDTIVLRKHLIMQNLKELAQRLINIFSSVNQEQIIITDREKIISVSELYNDLNGQKIDNKLLKYIDNREIVNELDSIVFESDKIIGNFAIVPIISEADSIGLVIVNSKNNLNTGKIIAKILANKVSIE